MRYAFFISAFLTTAHFVQPASACAPTDDAIEAPWLTQLSLAQYKSAAQNRAPIMTVGEYAQQEQLISVETERGTNIVGLFLGTQIKNSFVTLKKHEIRPLLSDGNFAMYLNLIEKFPDEKFEFGSTVPKLGNLQRGSHVLARDGNMVEFVGQVENMFSNNDVLVRHGPAEAPWYQNWPISRLWVLDAAPAYSNSRTQSAPIFSLDELMLRQRTPGAPVVSHRPEEIPAVDQLILVRFDPRLKYKHPEVKFDLIYPALFVSREGNAYRYKSLNPNDGTFLQMGNVAMEPERPFEWAVLEKDGFRAGMKVMGTDLSGSEKPGTIVAVFSNDMALIDHGSKGGRGILWTLDKLTRVQDAS